MTESIRGAVMRSSVLLLVIYSLSVCIEVEATDVGGESSERSRFADALARYQAGDGSGLRDLNVAGAASFLEAKLSSGEQDTRRAASDVLFLSTFQDSPYLGAVVAVACRTLATDDEVVFHRAVRLLSRAPEEGVRMECGPDLAAAVLQRGGVLSGREARVVGRFGSSAEIPALRTLRMRTGGESIVLRSALARLGDADALKEHLVFLREVNERERGELNSAATEAGYVGHGAAVEILLPFVSDEYDGSERYGSVADRMNTALWAIALRYGLSVPVDSLSYEVGNYERWRSWFERNEEKLAQARGLPDQ